MNDKKSLCRAPTHNGATIYAHPPANHRNHTDITEQLRHINATLVELDEMTARLRLPELNLLIGAAALAASEALADLT